MNIVTANIARSTLEEFIGVTDPMPRGHYISAFQAVILNALSGRTQGSFHLPAYPRLRTEGYLKVRDKDVKLCELVFDHAELALRFMRIDSKTQDEFLEDIVRFLWEHEDVERLELTVKWGTNSIRTMRIERDDFDGTGGRWTNIKFSLA